MDNRHLFLPRSRSDDSKVSEVVAWLCGAASVPHMLLEASWVAAASSSNGGPQVVGTRSSTSFEKPGHKIGPQPRSRIFFSQLL